MPSSFEIRIRIFFTSNVCQIVFGRTFLYLRLQNRMRITLIHNPKAGDAKHGRKQLRRHWPRLGITPFINPRKNAVSRKLSSKLRTSCLRPAVTVLLQRWPAGLSIAAFHWAFSRLGRPITCRAHSGSSPLPRRSSRGSKAERNRSLTWDLRPARGANDIFLKGPAAACLQITFAPQRKTRKRTGRLKNFPKNNRLRAMAHSCVECCTTIRSVNGRSRSTERIFPAPIFFGKR